MPERRQLPETKFVIIISLFLLLLAAARLVFRLRRYDHVTDTLAILHWLRLPERVNFKLALMAYRVLHGMAPEYLNQLVPVSDLPSRRRLLSSSTLQLLVPPIRQRVTYKLATLRGVYPYLPMATNAPRSIFFGGGMNKNFNIKL